jgi:DNA-binding transcriptional ArsR family regulator
MDTKKIAVTAKMLKAMANEKRLTVLKLIADDEMSVGAIEKAIGLSQSALSQHLALLRAAGVVKTRRRAQTIYYALQDERVKQMLDLLQQLF